MPRANHVGRDEAAALVRRALALALDRPSLLDAHDAAIRAALPACPPALAAIYERFRAESASAAIATLGEPDGDDVASAVGEWASASGNGVATEWCAVLDLRPPPMKASDTERELRALAKRLAVAGDDSPIAVRLADVRRELLDWLWPGRIPLGKLTLLAGDPGLGKSFVTLDIAARVSRGDAWPDAPLLRQTPGGVVLFNAEDDLADTIAPRLDKMNADDRNIVAVEGVSVMGQRRHFSLECDLPRLAEVLDENPDARLVVVDPISAYTGKVDSHNNTDVRGLLAPLAELASKRRVAIVAVTHLSKSGGTKAVYRAMGSLAFAAASRAVWAIIKDQTDPQRRLFLPAKLNLARDLDGLAYRIENGRVVWENEPVAMNADTAIAVEQAASVRKPGPPDETLRGAEVWLAAALADGPRLAKDLKDEWCNAHGGSKRTLYRAKEKLNVEAFRETIPGPWFWRRPNIANQGCQSPRGEDLGNLGNLAKNTGFLPLFDADEPKVAKLSELGGLGPVAMPSGDAA